MSVLWSDYADNSDTGSFDNVELCGAQDDPADAPWSFLFEFAEPEAGQREGGAGAGGEVTDDANGSDEEFDVREYDESLQGSAVASSSAHLTEIGSSSGRSGWRLSHRSVPKSTDLCARYGGGSAASSSTTPSSGSMAASSASSVAGAGAASVAGGVTTIAGGVTTLMLRHLPNMYTRSMLVEELDSVGLGGTYDFLYLPIDKSTQWNVGYAFVNFTSPADASKCVGLLTDYVFQRYEHNSGKVTQVAVAHIQGLERNLEFFSKTAVQLGSRGNRPLVCAAKASSGGGSSASSSKKGAPARRRRRPRRSGDASGEPPTPGGPAGAS